MVLCRVLNPGGGAQTLSDVTFGGNALARTNPRRLEACATNPLELDLRRYRGGQVLHLFVPDRIRSA